MSQEYCRGVLRVCVAQICQHFGWTSIHSTPLELLTDVLERYLLQLGRVTNRYSEQFGRADPRIEDLQLAFGHMGVSLEELEDYVKHVEPLPFAKEVVAFPQPQPVDLKFPNPDSKEVQQRKVFEFVPEHLPYMHPELNEENEDSNPPLASSPERLLVAEGQGMEFSPGGQGEKRSLPSPGDPGMSFKRPRMTASNLPEEASHSQYEMQSVVMTNSGILSPLREGKLPDVKTPPTGFKQQIVIVKKGNQAATPTIGGKLSTDTPIIKLDFGKDTSGAGQIVQVAGQKEKNDSTKDPDFSVKKKKIKKTNVKEVKKKKKSGRPLSPARVVHKAGSAAELVSSLLKPRKDDSGTGPAFGAQNSPMDLTLKPTPPPLNISVKVEDAVKSKQDNVTHKTVEYRPKVTVISKEQEQDMEDTIAAVIEQSTKEVELKEQEEKKQKESAKKLSVEAEKVSQKTPILPEKEKETESETWRVKSYSETYEGNVNDSFESDSRGDEDVFSGVDSAEPNFEVSPHSKPTYQAPHLALLNTSPRPRGRPRGSTSGFYKTLNIRSPHGRKPGRPPLSRTPGRPSYMSRSPGRPPLNKSPGRPSVSGRSPGRPPGSARSPGRPKGSVSSSASPKPRGRPRGSKSPRGRGLSPREASPSKAVLNINFDENTSSSHESRKVAKEDANDSDATLFEFPSQSPDNRDSSSPKRKNRESSLEKYKTDTDFSDAPIVRPADVSPVRDRSLTPPSRDTRDRSSDSSRFVRERDTFKDRDTRDFVRNVKESITDFPKEPSWERDVKRESSEESSFSRDRSLEPAVKELSREKEQSSDREISELGHGTEGKDTGRAREQKETTTLDKEKDGKDRDRSKEHKKDKKKKKKKDKEKERERDKERDKDKEKKEKHKKEKEHREASPSVAPLQKLKIKFGAGPTSSSFSITSAEHLKSPKKDPTPPPPSQSRPEIPKLKLVLPKKAASEKSEQSWVSSIKKDPSPAPSDSIVRKPSPKPSSPKHTPSHSSVPLLDSDQDTSRLDESDTEQGSNKDVDEEVTVSVVKGKIVTTKKASKVKKRRGSSKKGRPKAAKGSIVDVLRESVLAGFESTPSPPASALSVPNVPSPITIPALKAAPPPPSPPTAKKSPPKPKSTTKESRPYSPLFKEEVSKPKPPPVQIPKSTGKNPKTSPRRSSPRKSPKVSPSAKKKSVGPLFPNFPSTPSSVSNQSSTSADFPPPRTPSPSNIPSPSGSVRSSPMYSPDSSPSRDSPPLVFTIPPTPAFPTRTHSPPLSPLTRQMSTDDEKETTPPVEKTKMLPPSLPPMPPSSAMRKTPRTVRAETVGSFVNEVGERIWICPACTLQDDGSPMIGCDVCDDWYHWPCVSITEEPDEDEQWYCPKCVKPVSKTGKSKRGRKKKKP